MTEYKIVQRRELSPLRNISDNYEKVVLSMDRSFIKSYEGIKLTLRTTKVGGFLSTKTSDILSPVGIIFHLQGTTYKDWSISLR
ncbi:MAG: hypothetical protein WA125_15450, partial [Desulfosporosinus sp.]